MPVSSQEPVPRRRCGLFPLETWLARWENGRIEGRIGADAAPCFRLLTVYAEAVMRRRLRTVGIDGDVERFMDQVVVARTLPDHPEIVDERLSKLTILQGALERILGDTRC